MNCVAVKISSAADTDIADSNVSGNICSHFIDQDEVKNGGTKRKNEKLMCAKASNVKA